jgi:hypothetical protein
MHTFEAGGSTAADVTKLFAEISQTLNDAGTDTDTAGELDLEEGSGERLSKEKGLKRPLQDSLGSSSKRAGKENFARDSIGSSSEIRYGDLDAVDQQPSTSSLLWVEMNTVALGGDKSPTNAADLRYRDQDAAHSIEISLKEGSVENAHKDAVADCPFEGSHASPAFPNCANNFEGRESVPDINIRPTDINLRGRYVNKSYFVPHASSSLRFQDSIARNCLDTCVLAPMLSNLFFFIYGLMDITIYVSMCKSWICQR